MGKVTTKMERMFLKMYTDCSIVYTNIRSHYITMREVHTMETKELRKHLHELIDKMDDSQIKKIYQLIRGIFGKAV